MMESIINPVTITNELCTKGGPGSDAVDPMKYVDVNTGRKASIMQRHDRNESSNDLFNQIRNSDLKLSELISIYNLYEKTRSIDDKAVKDLSRDEKLMLIVKWLKDGIFYHM